MYFLSSVKDIFIDFLFPKSKRVLELEALSVDKLLYILPPAEGMKDKYTLALFDYSHSLVKEVIWELKYSGNVRIVNKLGEILYDYIRQEILNLALFENWGTPILLPIPMSNKRKFERGWNQTELLIKVIVQHDREKAFRYLPGQLIKYRHTDSQTKIASKNERLENLTNSMKVLNASSVAGACVIVLDDVTTTGATFDEARRALRVAGAEKILCVAIAH